MSQISVLPKIRVTCAGGSAGTSSGQTDTERQILGEIEGFLLKYSATPASTIDTQIDTLGADGLPGYQILKLTDNVTDGLFLVRKLPVSTAGAALSSDDSLPIPVMDKLKCTLAQGNVGDYVDIWTFYRPSD